MAPGDAVGLDACEMSQEVPKSNRERYGLEAGRGSGEHKIQRILDLRGRFCRRQKPERGKGYCKRRECKIEVLGMGGDWGYGGCPVMEGK